MTTSNHPHPPVDAAFFGELVADLMVRASAGPGDDPETVCRVKHAELVVVDGELAVAYDDGTIVRIDLVQLKAES